MGNRRLTEYREFFSEISNYGNNYYFSCNEFRNSLYNKMSIMDVFNMVNEIQYNISIDFEEDIDNIINDVITKYNNFYYEKLKKQLTIFAGGCGSNILSKYDGGLKSIYINNYDKDFKNNKIETIILSNDACYLDDGVINYNYYIDDFKEKEEIITKYIKNVDRVLIVCGLGGIYGTAGLIYLSNLCSKLRITCDAIVSVPFKFEGKARYFAAMEALKKCHSVNLIQIKLETVKNKLSGNILKNESVSNIFNKADNMFLEYLDLYEKFYVSDKEISFKSINDYLNTIKEINEEKY